MSWFSKKKTGTDDARCTSIPKNEKSNVLEFKKKTENSVLDKQEIQMYIEQINNKLKDPAMARKAAHIVTELLRKNG